MLKLKIKSSLLAQYVMLFSLIAIIPVATICTAVLLSNQALKEEVVRSNQSSLELIQQSLDSKIVEFENIPSLIGQNPSLTKNSLQNTPLKAITDLKEITSTHNFLSNVIIKIRGTEQFYSTYGTFKLQDIQTQNFMRNLELNGFSCEEWLEVLEGATSPTFWPVNTLENSPDYLYFFSPVYNAEFEYKAQNASRIAVILINKEYIQDLFRASQTNMEENILLLNTNKELLFHLAPNVTQDTIREICEYLKSEENPSEIGYLSLDGVENIIFVSRSMQTGLYYVRFLPENIAYQTINQIRSITLVIMLVVILISIFLVYSGIKYSYVPIRTLADWLQTKKTAKVNTRNELVLFKKIFDETFEQNDSLSELINNSKYGLIDYFLKDLICGNFSTEKDFRSTCRKLSIQFNRKNFVVACLLFESNTAGNSDIDFNKILKLIRDDLPADMIIQVKDLLFAGKLILVMNSDSDSFALYETTVAEIKQRLLDQQGLLTSIGMGSCYDSFEHVGKSYLEAINALDYRLIYGKDCLITPSMHQDKHNGLTYPNRELAQLYSSLISRDAEGAFEIISKLNAYAKSQHCTLHSAKYICYDTFAILKKVPAFEHVGFTDSSENLNITHLTDYDTVDDFFASLQSIVQNTIGVPANVVSESDLGEQMVNYINQHCFSYNFQISTIAEHFSISQPSMRKQFREYTGVGISDYVTNIKVDRAMQLLRDTDTNLQEIVTQIGNTDTSAFIRLFKKKTGVTPGQYRKTHRG